MRRALSAVAALASIATLALVAGVAVQAPGVNGPAEWRWEYRPPGLSGAWAPALLGLLLLGAYALWDRRATPDPPEATSRGRRRIDLAALAVLILIGWGFTLALVGAQPGGLGRVLASLASRLSFGYVYDAGLAPPTAELLADYPAASAGLDLHARTHPPGALLAVRGVARLTRGLPLPPAYMEGEVGQTAGGGLVATARDALAREVTRARDHRRPVPTRLPGPWTLVVLAFLLPALSALAAWPLARLAAAWGLPPAAARLAVLLWLTVPARSLFTPSLDQALPLLAAGALALAAGGGRGVRDLARGFGAGVLLFLATFLSYGCLALLPWAGLVALLPGAAADGAPTPIDRSERARGLARPAALGLGFLLPWVALVPLAGYSPWAAFRAGILTHRSMAVVTRGYATWLVWNPYDFALLLGPPILLLALAAPFAARRARAREAGAPEGEPAVSLAYRVGLWSFWALIALLWISGSVRGEVGRIWLLFMPFACLFAASAIVTGREAEGAGPGRWALALAALELALCLALAATMTFVS